MRILLDECVNARLRHELPGHEVQTVSHAGWAGIKNGQLLRLVADSGRFDVLLTLDKSMPHQQQLMSLPFAVVIMRTISNDIVALRPLLPELLQRLPEFLPGHAYVLNAPE